MLGNALVFLVAVVICLLYFKYNICYSSEFHYDFFLDYYIHNTRYALHTISMGVCVCVCEQLMCRQRVRMSLCDCELYIGRRTDVDFKFCVQFFFLNSSFYRL